MNQTLDGVSGRAFFHDNLVKSQCHVAEAGFALAVFPAFTLTNLMPAQSKGMWGGGAEIKRALSTTSLSLPLGLGFQEDSLRVA